MRYDHLVIGAGSTGVVIAARLSEDPSRTVLLVEAGPDYRSAETPGAVAGPNFFAALGVPELVWPEITAARVARAVPQWYPRGRGVGGSSAVNGLMALPGLAGDYDRWERDFGAEGWGAAGMAAPLAAAATMLRLSTPGEQGAVGRAFVAAARATGHPFAARPDDAGVGPVPLTVDRGRRVSVSDAYLEPARERPNLTVLGNALVDRLLVDEGHVVGVRLAGGDDLEAREVILSAGALCSPAILLRSGLDRPGVGANLKDHPSFRVTLWLEDRARATTVDVVPATTMLRWSSGPGAEADLHAVPFDVTGADAAGLAAGMVLTALVDARSAGRVALASGDPSAAPLVELNQLSDEHDVDRLTTALAHIAELTGRPEVRAIARRVTAGATNMTPAEVLDGDVPAWLRANLDGYVHAAGTCRMGRPDDPLAVVDATCRVLGVGGLRVADASVMPDLPRANPHLTCVAIGERVAALIRAGN